LEFIRNQFLLICVKQEKKEELRRKDCDAVLVRTDDEILLKKYQHAF